jgi:hypothetical protein
MSRDVKRKRKVTMGRATRIDEERDFAISVRPSWVEGHPDCVQAKEELAAAKAAETQPWQADATTYVRLAREAREATARAVERLSSVRQRLTREFDEELGIGE